MSLVIQEQNNRPFRVPGYTGYIPGLKYSFGHTYGYSEGQLFKPQHQETVKETDCQSAKNVHLHPTFLQEVVPDPCLHRNGFHQKLSKISPDSRHVQWRDKGMRDKRTAMDMVKLEEPRKNASVQCSPKYFSGTREEVRSAGTQWSDQEAEERKKLSASTQWSPIDLTPLKTIPGYTGHLPGRHFVNPGKTFCQEIDALLMDFHPKSATVFPRSRHDFTSALQQINHTQEDSKEDPYFDNRPPSTYSNNFPIPGYQGFVPRVRTSTSSLGVRYIKAVEKSLRALHERLNPKSVDENGGEKARPLHTPRHKPHPRQKLPSDDDWKMIYRRPPSTYLDSSRTYIPGYKGFVPHIRCSPSAVGMRYSKAAMMCLGPSKSEGKIKSDESCDVLLQNEETQHVDKVEQQNGDLSDETIEVAPYDEYGHTEYDAPTEKLCEVQHLKVHNPSTPKYDERNPIPGYQGFVPRMRDSPTTLGLRYTKAAQKTLQDVHKKSE